MAKAEPENLAKDLDQSVDFFEMGIHRIDGGLGDLSQLEKVEIQIESDDPIQFPNTANKTWKGEGCSGILSLGKANAPKATEEEIEEALRETLAYPIKRPEILNLAERAVRGIIGHLPRVV
jgi:hypothetical protein